MKVDFDALLPMSAQAGRALQDIDATDAMQWFIFAGMRAAAPKQATLADLNWRELVKLILATMLLSAGTLWALSNGGVQ